MAQVPYQPVPSVAPSTEGTPGVNVPTPIEAFGGGIARALEGASGELFNRAIALQQLRNETEAKEADAQYMIDAGDLHAKFSALQGKDAVDAYPKYAQDLQSLRQRMRAGLSNDMARRMFDSSSLSTMSRSIFNGAGHAATMQKEYSINTELAQMDLNAKTIEDNPYDNAAFNERLGRIKASASNVASLKGMGKDSPLAEVSALKATSKAWAQRIIGMSRTDPFGAAQFLDEHRKELTNDDYLKVDNAVRAQSRAVGSVNIANDVYDPNKSLAEMEDEVRSKAASLDPSDPLLPVHGISALQHKYNQDKYATQREKVNNEQMILTALQGGVKNDQELFANPEIKKAYDALPPDSFLKKKPISYEINQYNNQRDQDLMDQNWVRLRGMASNDVRAFLETNINSERLLPAKRDQLLAIRAKLIQHQEADPRVGRALSLMRTAHGAELEALHIYNRGDDKNAYDHYTGILQSALDVWQEVHGKPPSAKDITDTIGPQIIQQRSEPGKVFGKYWPTQKSFFERDVPESFVTEMTRQVVEAGGNPPTPEQLYKAYARQQYIKSRQEFLEFYSKKPKEGAE